MKIFAMDIETVPCRDLPEECVPKFDPDEVKLGNLKDPVKIQAKLTEAEVSFTESLSKTMSLDPALAQLCVFVGIKYDTQAETIIDEHIYYADDDHDDYEAIFHGWELIVDSYYERVPIVTFNGKSFDLPVMLFRAIQQDVPIDLKTYDELTYRYQNQHHYDLLQMLSGWEKNKWHKLDFYLKLFGLQDKNDMDGSMVYPLYQAGEHDKIKEYCRNDVIANCELFTRVEPWIVRKKEEKDHVTESTPSY